MKNIWSTWPSNYLHGSSKAKGFSFWFGDQFCFPFGCTGHQRKTKKKKKKKPKGLCFILRPPFLHRPVGRWNKRKERKLHLAIICASLFTFHLLATQCALDIALKSSQPPFFHLQPGQLLLLPPPMVSLFPLVSNSFPMTDLHAVKKKPV